MNITEVINSPIAGKIDVTQGINNVVFLLKAIGILFVVYIIFLIIKGIFNIIEKRRIKKIYKKVIEIDEKLDLLLKKHGKNKRMKQK